MDPVANPALSASLCRFHVDIAPAGRITDNPFTVAGWFFDEQGRAARQIRIRIGPRVIICDPVDQPDLLSRFPGAPPDSGFRRVIKTGTGLKLVVLEAETESGRTIELYHRLLWMRPPRAPATHDYIAWLAEDARVNPPPIPPAAGPLISVLMPVYNPPERWLRRAVESVLAQTYSRWELCIANDASTHPAIRPLLDGYAARDPRIKVVHRPQNGHISAASNSALELCTGEFTALLDHDDELPPRALARVAIEIDRHPDAAYFYSDEDKITETGHRFAPYFKPDYLPDLLLGQNCLSHLSVIRTDLIRQVGGFRVGLEGSQDWDLSLRVVERLPPEHVRHIPEILYHWRAIQGSTALAVGEKDYTVTAAHRALSDHFARQGKGVKLTAIKSNHWRATYPLPTPPPLVSLVIPTRNRAALVRACVNSILRKTTYPAYEILIVDNQSDDPETLAWFEQVQRTEPRVRVVPYPHPFNYSALNNHGARQARGTILGLLNNDLEIISSDWLDEMASHALRPEIGAVGAMLYYPDDTIQHAGVVLGLGGVANHAFLGRPRGTDGYLNRARLTQNYSAVTAACMVIRREIFEQVGGFNERDLAVAFNDVDFCLRVRAAGYRNLWTPFAELYHHESASRGKEDTEAKRQRFAREVDYMRRTWGPLLENDPAYNPNLTLVHEDFSLAHPPRVATTPKS